MSTAILPTDYKNLIHAAHETLLDARKACGSDDALTMKISSLYDVLLRLSTSVDVAGVKSSAITREGDNRRRGLAILARECAQLLSSLDHVLKQYNELPENQKKATQLWRSPKLRNSELLKVDKMKRQVRTYAEAIDLLPQSTKGSTVGRAEGYMDTHGTELKELKLSLHWAIAKLLALQDENREHLISSWRTSVANESLRDFVMAQMSSEGWSEKVLGKYRKLILSYIIELSERGTLDGIQRCVVELDGTGNLEDDDNTQLPLGQNGSAKLSIQTRPSKTQIHASEAESPASVELCDDNSNYEGSNGQQHVVAASAHRNQPIAHCDAMKVPNPRAIGNKTRRAISTEGGASGSESSTFPNLASNIPSEMESVNDSSSDMSEQSYLIIRPMAVSEIKYDGGQENAQIHTTAAKEMKNIPSDPRLKSSKPIANRQHRDGPSVFKHSRDASGEVDNQGDITAWSVILSHVGEDHESTLLETSAVWATNSSAPEPANESALAGISVSKTQAGIPAREDPQTFHAEFRNQLPMGKSDKDQRPSSDDQLWDAGVSDITRRQDQHTDSERNYRSSTDDSITVSGGSDDEASVTSRNAAREDLKALQFRIDSPAKHSQVTHSSCESENESTSDDSIGDTLVPPIHAIPSNKKRWPLQTRPSADCITKAVHQSRSVEIEALENSNADDAMQYPERNAVDTDSFNGSIQSAMDEANDHSNGHLTSRSSSPSAREVDSLASSRPVQQPTPEHADFLQHQPKLEEAEEEDAPPSTHPKPNVNAGLSQGGSDMKFNDEQSGSVRNASKPYLVQYFNPFRETSKAKFYKLDPTSSSDEPSSFGFPSSASEDEDVRRYRSNKKVFYEDPDFSFNSSLDETPPTERSNTGKTRQAQATSFDREFFKETLKTDYFSKKNLIPSGKGAVWGSASEREERRNVRGSRKTSDRSDPSVKTVEGKNTVTFEIDKRSEYRLNAEKKVRPSALRAKHCQPSIEDVLDEDFLPGAHPNCDLWSNVSQNENVVPRKAQTNGPQSGPSQKITDNKIPVSSTKASSNSPSRPTRNKHSHSTQHVAPQSDEDQDDDLRRYRCEETAQRSSADPTPNWRTSRAYRNKKNKQRRLSQGEEEKFWDEPLPSWVAETGSSEDDWGASYRSDNSRNSSNVAIGGCTCCASETHLKRRRQHYRPPPVIHHPELVPVSKTARVEMRPTAPAGSNHARRRSSIDPWSLDHPIEKKPKREKASESPTYHVPDAPAPAINSTRSDLPSRRKPATTEPALQTARQDVARPTVDLGEKTPQLARLEVGNRHTRTPVKEHSPRKLSTEGPNLRIENNDDSYHRAKPVSRRRLSRSNESPTKPQHLGRQSDTVPGSPVRPDIGRRRTVEREDPPAERRPKAPKRAYTNQEPKMREKILRFDI